MGSPNLVKYCNVGTANFFYQSLNLAQKVSTKLSNYQLDMKVIDEFFQLD